MSDYISDPTIEVTATECIAGLTAADQQAIAGHQWEVDEMRRLDPEGRWWWVPWPLNRVPYRGDLNRPCDCARHIEDRMGGRLDHSPRIEHVEGLAPEEQVALADYIRQRDADEPVNWKILRRWRIMQSQSHGYLAFFKVDKDRDPPIWFDRSEFVKSRNDRYDSEELDAMSRSDESYAKNEAEEYERAKQRHEALLACASRLPVERAVLDAMPADCAFRQEQMFQVAILQHEVDGMRPGPPPPRTSAEARAGQLSSICRRRRGIDEEVAAAERDLADVAPRLRAFLTALDPANW